jgi:hypothetical protein
MDDLVSKTLPVFLAFVLGLVAEPIKRALTREKRTLVYDIIQTPIVSVSDELPDELDAKLPDIRTKNTITKTEVNVTNPGPLIVKRVNFSVRTPEARIIYQRIFEKPARLITHSDEINEEAGEITISDFTLEPMQSITCSIFTESKKRPLVDFEGSSKEDVVTWRKGRSLAFGLDDHLLAMFKLWIFATFARQLITGIPLAFGQIFPGGVQMTAVGLAQALGSILSLYFYLKMIPHALIVFEALESRFFKGVH